MFACMFTYVMYPRGYVKLVLCTHERGACMYINKCMYSGIYVSMCVWYVCTYVCVCVCVCGCMHVCGVCMCVCMYICKLCMYVCKLCMYVYMYVYLSMHAHIWIICLLPYILRAKDKYWKTKSSNIIISEFILWLRAGSYVSNDIHIHKQTHTYMHTYLKNIALAHRCTRVITVMCCCCTLACLCVWWCYSV